MNVILSQNFFEGVQTLVAQGVKEEEIGYQMAFNKQELRKVIKEYPGKEVSVDNNPLCITTILTIPVIE